MNKKVVSTCLAGSMLLSLATMPAAAVSVDSFTDVNKNDWFYPGVQYVAEKDYMIGVGGDRFAPAMEMTRSMFVTILYRIEGVKDESQKSQFKDVPDGTWYTQAVNWAAANGIVEGNGADMFLPDNLITRQDMCTMMSRYITYHEKKNNVKHEKNGEAKTFADEAQISDYAVEAVKNCVSWGLIEGNELGYFLPLNTASRAEVATVVSRLSWKSNSTGGIGGGGSTSQTANYGVKAALKLPDGRVLDLTVAYNNVTVSGGSVSNDATFGKVANDLVSGDNATALKNAITEALKKVYGKTFTQTLNDQLVTISIDDAGVVSATVSVKVTDVTGQAQGFSLLAAPADQSIQEQMEALINKLQNGGEMTFTKDEVLVMDDLIAEIGKVDKMSPEEIQDKIDQVVAEKPELEQVVSGMTPEAVKEAAKDYQTQVQEVMDQVLADAGVDSPADLEEKFESAPVVKEPVTMNVAMDLGAYFDQAQEKYQAEMSNAIDRIEAELGLNEIESYSRAKLESLYMSNQPGAYVTKNVDENGKNTGTLTLKTAEEYFDMLTGNVSSVSNFYASLGQDEAYYKSLLQRVENKYQEGYGVTYTDGFVDGMADLLGDKDGIFVDGTTFRDDMTFAVTVDVTEENYTLWRDLIAGKWSQADVLPSVMPDALKSLLGTYTLSFEIDKK